MRKEEIDQTINQWYHIIENAINISIPSKTKYTLQRAISSPYLHYIQHQCTQLQQQARIQGWERQKYYRYRLSKTMLKIESERIKNKN